MSSSVPNPLPTFRVAAGILTRNEGQVLIAQRPAGKHMAGDWEFPGGKISPEESRLEGLVRELDEELGIQVRYARYLMQFTHVYPERIVHLTVWKVFAWQGEPDGREGQAIRWLHVDELSGAGLLPADKVIIDLLQKDCELNRMSWEKLSAAVSD